MGDSQAHRKQAGGDAYFARTQSLKNGLGSSSYFVSQQAEGKHTDMTNRRRENPSKTYPPSQSQQVFDF